MLSSYKSYKVTSSQRVIAHVECNNVTVLTLLTSAAANAPLQTTLAPRPDKTLDEQEQENQNGDERADRQSGKRDGKRHEKHRLDVEDQEDDGIQIVLRPELNVRLTNGLDPALVDGVFFRPRFWRLEKSPPHPRQEERHQRKGQRHTNENNDKQIGIRGHRVSIKFARKESLPSL